MSSFKVNDELRSFILLEKLFSVTPRTLAITLYGVFLSLSKPFNADNSLRLLVDRIEIMNTFFLSYSIVFSSSFSASSAYVKILLFQMLFLLFGNRILSISLTSFCHKF
jgi:hypothetical protein